MVLIHKKYVGANIIIGGDFNEAPDDNVDRCPPRNNTAYSKHVTLLCDKLNVIEAWRFLHPHNRE